MPSEHLPEWERVLSAAAHLQDVLPGAVLVGGTAAAVYAGHRISVDADHVIADLKAKFDIVLFELESVAGWKTARIARPVMILGSLDGIETGIRQLIRDAPLETRTVEVGGAKLTIPTEAEIFAHQGCTDLEAQRHAGLCGFRGVGRSYGRPATIEALRGLDELYPQPNDESALLQLQIQLSMPLPFDLDDMGLAEYKNLVARWHQWPDVRAACESLAILIFDKIIAA